MTNWMLDLIITHRRLRSLTEAQLRDLIESAGDIESLRIIKEHLEGGSFKYPHIQTVAVDMIERCKERAADILWKEHEGEARRIFMKKIGNPLEHCFVYNKAIPGKSRDMILTDNAIP